VDVDTALVRHLGIDPGVSSHWVAQLPDTSHSEVLLLRDGTEESVIDSLAWKRTERWARDSMPREGVPGWKLPGVPTKDNLLTWTTPPEGLSGHWGAGTSRSVHSSIVGRQDLGVEFDLPWRGWVSAGVSAGAERLYHSMRLDSVSTDAGQAWWPYYGFRACVRTVCWDARTSDDPIPRELWTESKIDSLIGSHQKGDFSRRWGADPSTLGGNWSQSISARVGVLGWKGTWASDSWTGCSQEFSLSPLPGGPIQWGLLAGMDDAAAWTGFVVGMEPRRVFAWKGYGLDLAPFEFVFRYSSANLVAAEIRSSFLILPPWKLK